MENQNSERKCGNCKHFRRHYVKHGRSFLELSYGHCVFPRLKKREDDEKACEHHKARA